MEELDVLKKDWQKRAADLPELSNKEIENMLLKKSSSIVKWIFVISLLEFTLPHLFLLLPSSREGLEFYHGLPVYNVLIAKTIIYYLGVAFFIRQFYIRYRDISITDNVKDLLRKIIDTRKTVRNYVIFCLSMAFLFICVVVLGVYLTDSLPAMLTKDVDLSTYSLETAKAILMISISITGVIILGFMGLIYFLMYGLLLRKLFRNYTELSKREL